MMKLLIIFFIIGFIFLASCNDNGVNNNQHKFTRSSFPVAAGNWWRYQVIDSLNNNAIDTIVIKVDSSVNIDGVEHTSFKCHIEQNNEFIDSAWISLNETNFSYNEGYLKNETIIGNYTFKLPFSEGDSWLNINDSNLIDSFFVISYNIYYNYQNDIYNNVYTISKENQLDSTHTIYDKFIVGDKIGLISFKKQMFYHNEVDLLYYNKIFNLIDYKLE